MSNQESEMSEQTPMRLLEYYQKRIEAFEEEKAEWQTRFQATKVTQDEFHKIQWDLEQKNNTITEIQNQLNQANFILYEERNQKLIIKRKFESAQLKNLQSKKHIAELLSITQPQQELLNREFGHSIDIQRIFLFG